MTWPEPPRPFAGVATTLAVIVGVLISAYLISPVFSCAMRVLR